MDTLKNQDFYSYHRIRE